MSEVTFLVGGRKYTVACADGEEAHVQALGESIDAKLKQIGSLGPQEGQNLLFAALLLADDLHDANNNLATARGTQDNLEQQRDKAIGDAKAAMGQRDELRATITDREAELDGLQASQQRTALEMESILAELRQLKQSASETSAREAELRKAADALRHERDTLERRLNEVMDATPQTPAAGVFVMQGNDPALAPALERFAELLETCADKLEAGAATP